MNQKTLNERNRPTAMMMMADVHQVTHTLINPAVHVAINIQHRGDIEVQVLQNLCQLFIRFVSLYDLNKKENLYC